MKNTTAINIIAAMLILLFIYAGASKLLDYRAFVSQLSESPVFGRLASLLAFIVPVLEIVIAILLYKPKTRLAGLYASLILLSSFTLYLIALLSFNTHLPCSCGGILTGMGWKAHIYFNMSFIVLCIVAILLWKRNLINSSPDNPLSYTTH